MSKTTDVNTAEVTTLDFNEAFPTIARDEREFGISLSYPRGGSEWEFMVAEVPGHPGQPPIGIQVRMFDDSWRAYTEIPEFFTALAARSAAEGKVTLDDVKVICRDLGYPDRTSTYTDRHEHQFRCACGAHLTD